MRILDKFSGLPEKTYIMLFTGIFLIMCFFLYFTREDTLLMEKKIVSKQKDLAAVLALRDSYETKKRMFDRYSPKKIETKGMSLAVIEEMAAKNFVGGKLTALQPATIKEEKGGQQATVEVKVAGAPLGEVISFLRAAETEGLYTRKLRLSLPAGSPGGVDMHATITERHTNG